ncbi:MAG: hypothetical protein NC250_00130 [Alistipes senegalensis]|nr:hypothetical protein [Bacteroides cellulosilyticus]MCM1351131.1 hypothetical protein [Alistipes senegalensis]
MKETEERAFDAETPENNAEEIVRDDTLNKARKNMVYGALWCLGGLLVSELSYRFTESGGRYVITTGAIIWGAVQMLQGAVGWIRTKWATKEYASAVWTGAAAAIVLAGVGYFGFQLTHPDDVPLIDHQQHYDCAEIGLRYTLPAGFTEIEERQIPETDETYARTEVIAYNADEEVAIISYVGALGEDTAENRIEHLKEANAQFFDDGMIAEPEIVEINGIRMLKTSGRNSNYPDCIIVSYDFFKDNHCLSFYYTCPSETPAADYDRRADELVAKIELY